jgi:hypothetical protein
MNERTRDALLMALALVALIAIAFAKDHARRTGTHSIFSTYDSGRNGYSALYDVLQTAGVPVARLRSSLSRFDGGGTLVITDNEGDPSAIGFGKPDQSALLRFVKNGGRLVVLATSFDGDRDLTPHVPQTREATITVAAASPALRARTGITSVEAPAESSFARTRHVTGVLHSDDGTDVAIAYSIGKGWVIASTSPQSLGNAWLLRRDNLRFAYAVLAGHGTVTFDEYLHGYNDDLTFWEAVPQPVKAALIAAAAIVIIGLIGANIPFAPPVPLDAPDERTSAAYVQAMGSLLRRARARTDAIAALLRNARRGSSSPQRDAALAELDRLAAGTPTDAALRRAASLEFQLRKERV